MNLKDFKAMQDSGEAQKKNPNCKRGGCSRFKAQVARGHPE
jgi:hypothetical protein